MQLPNPTPSRAQRLVGGKRERTRQRLIEAAAEVIGEKGLDRTSLEEVAARAGMSRGAIYGNFSGKEELFLVVAASRWKPIIPSLAPAGTSFKQRMRELGEAVAAAAAQRRADAVGATSFVLYALAHEEMRTLIERTNRDVYERAGAQLREAMSADDLPMPAEQLAKVIHALTEGLVSLHALTPNLITRAVIVAAFETLAYRPHAPFAPPPSSRSRNRSR
ncbi:MAG: TetR/AcrR family transcriptional regulator [Acidobacteria bacterium]|nr:TetR/AcrR family transcriptional regulator [Acidobacteriota bacterium]